MSEGHPEAARYPLHHLWSETALARERVNGKMATEATLMHSVIAAAISGKIKHLNDTLKELRDG